MSVRLHRLSQVHLGWDVGSGEGGLCGGGAGAVWDSAFVLNFAVHLKSLGKSAVCLKGGKFK